MHGGKRLYGIHLNVKFTAGLPHLRVLIIKFGEINLREPIQR
jgi:hypothetical protein